MMLNWRGMLLLLLALFCAAAFPANTWAATTAAASQTQNSDTPSDSHHSNLILLGVAIVGLIVGRTLVIRRPRRKLPIAPEALADAVADGREPAKMD